MIDEREQITEDWLKSVGFKWAQLDRQPSKHWILWIGSAVLEPDGTTPGWQAAEDLGIEISQWSESAWHCWFRSDSCSRYHRFIHLRSVLFYGQAWSPKMAEFIRKEAERLDRKFNEHPWTEAYKDPDRCKPLPEHVDAAIEGGKAK